jgi:hypothetical protein
MCTFYTFDPLTKKKILDLKAEDRTNTIWMIREASTSCGQWEFFVPELDQRHIARNLLL